jgi:hypothetical protein
MSMKNPNNTIGNQTRDLQAFSAVPQPIALPRASRKIKAGPKKTRYEPEGTYKSQNTVL